MTHDGHDDYQDRWVDGRAVESGRRDCQGRWKLIAPVLARYRRQFSLFDLGANRGYFSLRAVEEYRAVAVLADERDDLLPRPRHHTLLCLAKRLTAGELLEMGQTEHFDVVLALSVLHHFPAAESLDALAAVLALGDHVLIEYPTPDDRDCVNQDSAAQQFAAIEALHGQLLGPTASYAGVAAARKLALFEQRKRWIRGVGFRPGKAHPSGVHIVSDYDSKWAEKYGERRAWVHGLNLHTFLSLGGVWPRAAEVYRMVVALGLPAEAHKDIASYNYILDGQAVHFIDAGDPDRDQWDDGAAFEKVLFHLRRHGRREDKMNPLEDAIIDKLHGIAVQLGKMNEFLAWMQGLIEEELRKEDVAKKQRTNAP